MSWEQHCKALDSARDFCSEVPETLVRAKEREIERVSSSCDRLQLQWSILIVCFASSSLGLLWVGVYLRRGCASASRGSGRCQWDRKAESCVKSHCCRVRWMVSVCLPLPRRGDAASSNANKFNLAIDEENIDFNISGVPNAMVKRSHGINVHNLIQQIENHPQRQ